MATGHTPGEWTKVTAPTCTEDGVRTTTCTVCGEEYMEVIPATGHQYGEWAGVNEATETKEGLRERICSACGEKEFEVIPVLTTEALNNTNVAESDKNTASDTVNGDTSSKIPNTGLEMNTAIVAEFGLIAAAGAVLITLVVKRKIKKADR